MGSTPFLVGLIGTGRRLGGQPLENESQSRSGRNPGDGRHFDDSNLGKAYPIDAPEAVLWVLPGRRLWRDRGTLLSRGRSNMASSLGKASCSRLTGTTGVRGILLLKLG